MARYGAQPMKDPTKYFSREDMNRLLAAIPDKHKLLIYVLAKSGRRISEITRCLKPRDINFDENLINYTILKRKVPAKMLLPADPDMVRRLRSYIKSRNIGEDTHIFTLSRQRVDQLLKIAAENIGLKDAHAHMFRHTFAIRSAQELQSPAHLVELKDLLGHASIDTTMFYLRFNPKTQRSLLKRLWKSPEEAQ